MRNQGQATLQQIKVGGEVIRSSSVLMMQQDRGAEVKETFVKSKRFSLG
jgi:hypothetical protein